MEDLIKRDDVIKALDSNITVTGQENAEVIAQYLSIIIKRIRGIPSVDACEFKNIDKNTIIPTSEWDY